MSKIDEVKKILSLYLCEAADLDFRGMTEVTCKYAEQICQLFVPDKVKVREQTLREVGVWLSNRWRMTVETPSQGIYRMTFAMTDDEYKAFEQGRMP